MENELEELFLSDKYLQTKIKELEKLKSKLLMIIDPSYKNSENFKASNQKNDSESIKKMNMIDKIGKDAFEVIKKVFIKYSCIKDYINVRKLECLMLHKFLDDAELFSKSFNKVSADLLFYKYRYHGSIDF